jgi:L-threonylcarbamoyladenylate synthase
METLLLRVELDRLTEPNSQGAFDRAAEILRRGGTVAFPTETVYGLGANALDPLSIGKVFEAKERPSWDPLIVHVSDLDMLQPLVSSISEPARKLMEAFWPGPLTLLLPRSTIVPDAVTAGRPLVGLRMPAHPVASELIRRAGFPIAAPSANRFGHTSPTTAQHVLDDLDGRIDAVLDAGSTSHGLESTVLDPNAFPVVIYRPGAITLEQIRNTVGSTELYKQTLHTTAESQDALPSPGVGIRHYAPKAKLILIEAVPGKEADLALNFERAAHVYSDNRVGLMYPTGLPGEQSKTLPFDYLSFAKVFRWGNWSNPEELANRLYAGLRELDSAGCEIIICPLPSQQGIGEAIRDRLHKAAWDDRSKN